MSRFRNALIVIVSCLVPAAIQAQTNLAGSIQGTLTSAGNPHLVTASVQVDTGDSLHVMAGVEFFFAPGTGLDVSGVLRVEGTVALPVVFAPDSVGANAGAWVGVQTLTGSTTSMSHFEIDRATDGLHVLGGVATIEDGVIVDSSEQGLRTDQPTTVVRNVTIDGAGLANPGFAGFFVGGSGSATIEDCLIINCEGTGVGVFSPASPVFRNCEIADCRSGITSVGASPRIEGCLIRDHGIPGNFDSGAGIFVGFPSGTPVVVGTTIERTFFGVAIVNDGNVNLGDLGNADPSDDGDNVFVQNDTFDGTMRHVFNETTNPVMAQGNVWLDELGLVETDSTTIDSWIFDNEEVVSGGVVTFLPLGVPTSTVLTPAAHSWTVFPNPTGGELRWSLPAEANATGISVYDVAGRRVGTFRLEESQRAIDLQGVPAGVYFVALEGPQGVMARARVVRMGGR